MRHAPEVFGRSRASERAVREILPEHEWPDKRTRQGAPDQLATTHGLTLAEPLAEVEALAPGPFQTEWRPPDPTVAVGPNHIVSTVNMAFGIYDKASGELLFANTLNNYGDPGLFEEDGAAWFVFDPKCFYDHFAQRFVIVGLETYSQPFGAWVNIAVSDDADPLGVWYTYRTPADTGTAWWDYPGFGYSENAWVVTSNLIGGGGSGIRVFDKQSMLQGGPARYSTLTSPEFTLQVAQHLGAPRGPDAPVYLAATGGSTTVSLLAIRNPLTQPSLATFALSVPSEAGASTIPTPTDTIGNLVDRRMQTIVHRDGVLLTAKTVGAAGGSRARMELVATNGWPDAGTPTLLQTLQHEPGAGIHAFFPAATLDADGRVGLVMNLSAQTLNPSVAVAMSTPGPGARVFGAAQVVKTGSVGEGGRWGDYSGIAIDPTDDRTFWGIAEYKGAGGWATWIARFAPPDSTLPSSVADQLGVTQTGASIVADVLANDVTRGEPATIASFDATSLLGGTLSRVTQGGRDGLRYTAPAMLTTDRATDSFSYTMQTASGESTTTASVEVFETTLFTPPSPVTPGSPIGLTVDVYNLNDPQSFPDFGPLTPVASVTTTELISTDWGLGPLSGRNSDGVGLVYRGTIVLPRSGVHTIFLTANEGARLYIGGNLVCDNSGPNSSLREVQCFAGLLRGAHDVRLEYYERWERAGLTVQLRQGTWEGILGGQITRVARVCDTIDFNRNGLYPEDADLIDLLSVLAGGPCSTTRCGDIDINNDGLFPSDDDLIAFLRTLAGGAC